MKYEKKTSQKNTSPHVNEIINLHDIVPLEELIARKKETGHKVSIILPTYNEANTIEKIIDVWQPLRDAGLIDEIVTIDSGSQDETTRIAMKKGIRVYNAKDELTTRGLEQIKGKGENLWLAQHLTTADVLVFADSDMENPTVENIHHLLSPIITDTKIMLVKAVFGRDTYLKGATSNSVAGGRVTRLTANPFMQLLFPELSHIIQPLNGNIAIRRVAIETIELGPKYQADLDILLQTMIQYGADSIAQVHCGSFRQEGQSLEALEHMAHQYAKVFFENAISSERITMKKTLPTAYAQHSVSPDGYSTTTYSYNDKRLQPALKDPQYIDAFATHVTLVRHAPTLYNIEGRILGNTDLDIEPSTQKQYIQKLSDTDFRKPDLIVTSALKRTAQTALLLKTHYHWEKIPVIQDPRLNERRWGELEGKTRDEIRRKYPNIDNEIDSPHFRAEGAETMAELTKRVKEALYDLRKLYPGKNILVITHGGSKVSLGIKADEVKTVRISRDKEGDYTLV